MEMPSPPDRKEHKECAICCGQSASLRTEEYFICCHACNSWFHGSCVNVEEFEAVDLEKYHCSNCSDIAGPSTAKLQKYLHRYDPADEEGRDKPVQIGTAVFIQSLKEKHQFADAQEIIRSIPNGSSLTLSTLAELGFNVPIRVVSKDGLGLHTPPPDFGIRDIENFIGSSFEIDVISVHKQQSYHTTFAKFAQIFTDPSPSRVLNLISLEFSATSLNDVVHLPLVVDELCWVTNFWPDNHPDDLHQHKKFKPDVSKFCLLGMKDSYTDFHIDFGGTSVWYHVMWGMKLFYFVEPTDANLKQYEDWMTAPNHTELFFGDLVDKCYKLEVSAGQTLMIPTGWIHAVFTPINTLVFGGNFLHSLNVPLQMKIYELEMSLRTNDKFMFPNFELTCWHAANGLLEMIKEINEDQEKAPAYVLEGARSLLAAIVLWMSRDKVDESGMSKTFLTCSMSCGRLIKELGKEIRTNEKMTATGTSRKHKKKKSLSGRRSPRSSARISNVAISGIGDGNCPSLKVRLAVTSRSRVKRKRHAVDSGADAALVDVDDGGLNPPKTKHIRKKGNKRAKIKTYNDQVKISSKPPAGGTGNAVGGLVNDVATTDHAPLKLRFSVSHEPAAERSSPFSPSDSNDDSNLLSVTSSGVNGAFPLSPGPPIPPSTAGEESGAVELSKPVNSFDGKINGRAQFLPTSYSPPPTTGDYPKLVKPSSSYEEIVSAVETAQERFNKEFEAAKAMLAMASSTFPVPTTASHTGSSPFIPITQSPLLEKPSDHDIIVMEPASLNSFSNHHNLNGSAKLVTTPAAPMKQISPISPHSSCDSVNAITTQPQLQPPAVKRIGFSLLRKSTQPLRFTGPPNPSSKLATSTVDANSAAIGADFPTSSRLNYSGASAASPPSWKPFLLNPFKNKTKAKGGRLPRFLPPSDDLISPTATGFVGTTKSTVGSPPPFSSARILKTELSFNNSCTGGAANNSSSSFSDPFEFVDPTTVDDEPPKPSPSSLSLRPRRAKAVEDVDFWAEIGAYHVEGDFIYPSLLDSDDEATFKKSASCRKARAKKQLNANPAKPEVDPSFHGVVPPIKVERPHRPNARKECVEQAILAAKTQLEELATPKETALPARPSKRQIGRPRGFKSGTAKLKCLKLQSKTVKTSDVMTLPVATKRGRRKGVTKFMDDLLVSQSSEDSNTDDANGADDFEFEVKTTMLAASMTNGDRPTVEGQSSLETNRIGGNSMIGDREQLLTLETVDNIDKGSAGEDMLNQSESGVMMSRPELGPSKDPVRTEFLDEDDEDVNDGQTDIPKDRVSETLIGSDPVAVVVEALHMGEYLEDGEIPVTPPPGTISAKALNTKDGNEVIDVGDDRARDDDDDDDVDENDRMVISEEIGAGVVSSAPGQPQAGVNAGGCAIGAKEVAVKKKRGRSAKSKIKISSDPAVIGTGMVSVGGIFEVLGEATKDGAITDGTNVIGKPKKQKGVRKGHVTAKQRLASKLHLSKKIRRF